MCRRHHEHHRHFHHYVFLKRVLLLQCLEKQSRSCLRSQESYECPFQVLWTQYRYFQYVPSSFLLSCFLSFGSINEKERLFKQKMNFLEFGDGFDAIMHTNGRHLWSVMGDVQPLYLVPKLGIVFSWQWWVRRYLPHTRWGLSRHRER